MSIVAFSSAHRHLSSLSVYRQTSCPPSFTLDPICSAPSGGDMEGYNGGLKGYWKRKRYQRLGGGGGAGLRGWRWRSQRHRVELSTAGGQGEGAGGRRRRFWRIKIAPKLGFLRRAVATPRQLLSGLRDAYVRMMLRFANSRVFSAGGGLGYFGGDPAPLGFGPRAVKEYDEKMIVEIYKSLMAQGHLVAAGGGQGTQLVPRR